MKRLIILVVFIHFFNAINGVVKAEDFVKTENREFIRNGKNITGFKFDLQNVSLGRNYIKNFFIVVIIYKYEDGKRIYIDYQNYWWDSLNIYPNYYNSLSFNFKNPQSHYDSEKNLYFETTWYFTSSSY